MLDFSQFKFLTGGWLPFCGVGVEGKNNQNECDNVLFIKKQQTSEKDHLFKAEIASFNAKRNII